MTGGDALTRALVRAAVLVLPCSERARRHDEWLALLAQAPARLRLRYATDLAVKAPLLSRELHRADPTAQAGWGSLLAALALVAGLVGAGLSLLGAVVEEGAAEFAIAMTPLSLVPLAVLRAVRTLVPWGVLAVLLATSVARVYLNWSRTACAIGVEPLSTSRISRRMRGSWSNSASVLATSSRVI